jgi:hypothetical protein
MFLSDNNIYKYRQNLVSKITNSDKSQTPLLVADIMA